MLKKMVWFSDIVNYVDRKLSCWECNIYNCSEYVSLWLNCDLNVIWWKLCCWNYIFKVVLYLYFVSYGIIISCKSMI